MTKDLLSSLDMLIPNDRRWRVLVCGGRYNQDSQQVKNSLDHLWSMASHRLTLIEGGHPTGTDLWAQQWAQRHLMMLEWLHVPSPPPSLMNPKTVKERALDLWTYSPDLVLRFPGASPLADTVGELAAQHLVPEWTLESRMEVLV